MSFKRLYPTSGDNEITKGFPPFLKDAVSKWIYSHVERFTPEPSYYATTGHTPISDSFNAKISAAFRRNFGDNLESHITSISGNNELIADYINYLLQTYPDHASAQGLEDILSGANSEYTVHFESTSVTQNNQGLPDPNLHRGSISLQFRVPEEANLQLSELENNKRIQQAWNDLYDASAQNLPSVAQKSLDELAGAIRDRLYPNDKKTNLSDYAKRIELNIDSLDLPRKDKVDWPALIKSMANFVNTRSIHNSGTDTDPDYKDAHTVLHLCIALIVILRDKKE